MTNATDHERIRDIESALFGKSLCALHSLLEDDNRYVKFWNKFCEYRLQYVKQLEEMMDERAEIK